MKGRSGFLPPVSWGRCGYLKRKERVQNAKTATQHEILDRWRTNLTVATILFIIPWVVGPATNAVAWNAWIVGGLVAFNAGYALVGFAAWDEWTNLVLGLWAAASPWLFGFQANDSATWSYVILGGVIAVLAAAQLWLVDRQPPRVAA